MKLILIIIIVYILPTLSAFGLSAVPNILKRFADNTWRELSSKQYNEQKEEDYNNKENDLLKNEIEVDRKVNIMENKVKKLHNILETKIAIMKDTIDNIIESRRNSMLSV